MRLNGLINIHRYRKRLGSKDGSLGDSGRIKWVTSNFVLMFLENSIN
jgi:hypothetical protein